jgi:thymidylate kinase
MKKSIKFIVGSGPDGLGKTTQLNLLKSKLIEKGKNIHSTRLLGGTGEDEFQMLARKLLLHSKFPKNNHILEETLFALTDLEGIKQANEFLKTTSNALVLKDRGAACHYAYGIGRGLAHKELMAIHGEVFRQEMEINKEFGVLNILFVPDNIDWLLKRIASRNAKDGTAIIERLENREMQEKVVESLKIIPNLMDLQGLMFETIEVRESDSIQEVHDKVLTVLEKYEI